MSSHAFDVARHTPSHSTTPTSLPQMPKQFACLSIAISSALIAASIVNACLICCAYDVLGSSASLSRSSVFRHSQRKPSYRASGIIARYNLSCKSQRGADVSRLVGGRWPKPVSVDRSDLDFNLWSLLKVHLYSLADVVNLPLPISNGSMMSTIT